jgi:lysozyme
MAAPIRKLPRLHRLSPRGKSLIKSWEKLMLTAYKDQGGKDTIGWGHLMKKGEPRTINLAQAEQLLADDLAWVGEALYSTIKVPVSQDEYDALYSLVFNIGETKWRKSTLLRKLNMEDYRGAALQFPAWIYVGGKKSKGLENRRKHEQSIFVSALHT